MSNACGNYVNIYRQSYSKVLHHLFALKAGTHEEIMTQTGCVYFKIKSLKCPLRTTWAGVRFNSGDRLINCPLIHQEVYNYRPS